jgi:hypothetical protein
VSACTVLALVLVAAPAAADHEPSGAELASARSLFNEARAAEDRGEWGVALSKLDSVAKVKMTPQVRFHLGLCQEHTGRLLEALNNLERAASEGAEQNLPTVVEEANEHAAAVRTRVPKLFIVLPSGADPRVEVDGQTFATVLLSRPIPFDPGRHKIVAAAPGLFFSQEVTIAEREEKRVDVVFTRVPTSSSPSPSYAVPATAPIESPPKVRSDAESRSGGFFRSPTVGWVAVGVGGAALAGAAVSFLVRQNALNEIESECSTHENCPRHLESSQSTARTFGALTVALGIVGGASAVTGVVILAQPRRESASSKIGVAPWMTASGAGATGVMSW